MKKFTQKISRSGIGLIVMAIIMTISIFGTTQVYAAGIETLPYGPHNIGSFTFTNTNTTPEKTVSGTNVSFMINFKKASIDAGVGNVKLTVKVLDANTGAVISNTYYSNANEDGSDTFIMVPCECGYAGRKVKIWFDASSTGPSNGHYRSITITEFTSYVQ